MRCGSAWTQSGATLSIVSDTDLARRHVRLSGFHAHVYHPPTASYLTDDVVNGAEKLFDEAERLSENDTARSCGRVGAAAGLVRQAGDQRRHWRGRGVIGCTSGGAPRRSRMSSLPAASLRSLVSRDEKRGGEERGRYVSRRAATAPDHDDLRSRTHESR